MTRSRSVRVFAFAVLCAALAVCSGVHAQDAAATNVTDPTDTSKPVIGNDHPFVEFNGLTDGSWVVFIMITITASQLGVYFPLIGLPLITGYMFIGTLAGPYILQMISQEQIPNLGYVTTMALAFIAMSAGSELYLPEIRDLFKPIVYMSIFVAILVMSIVTVAIYALAEAGFVESLKGSNTGCVAAMSSVGASIMTARSPASAIAIVRELHAKGPFTSTMLGLTVVADVVVLVLYAITASFGLSSCHGGGFDAPSFFLTIGALLLAIALGYAFGKLLLFFLWLPKIRGEWTVLPSAFLVFLCADWFALYSLRWGYSIDIDALFICIVAGYVVTNQSANRHRFMKVLGNASPYIFIPFFTKTGITLNLPVLGQSLVFGIVIFLIRAACMGLGAGMGGYLGGLPKSHYQTIWLAQLTQAGVSLGLAARVAKTWAGIGSSYSTTLIAVILLNQIFGPITTKWAIKRVDEHNRATDDDDEHGHGHGGASGDAHAEAAASSGPESTNKTLAVLKNILDDVGVGAGQPTAVGDRKRLVVVGIDGTALALSQSMLNRDWSVLWLDDDQTKLALEYQLEYKKTGKRLTSATSAAAASTVAATPKSRSKSNTAAATAAAGGAAATAADGSSSVELQKLRAQGAGGDALPFVLPTPDPKLVAAGAAADSKTESRLTIEPAAPPLIAPGTAASDSSTTPRAGMVVVDDVRFASRQLPTPDTAPDAIPDENTPSALFAAVTDDLTPQNVAAVVLLGARDADNHAIARLLMRRHFVRVIVRVHNPLWAYVNACEGAIPVYSFSSELSVLEAALTCKTTSPADVSVARLTAGKGLNTALCEVIQPALHARFGQFAMTASQRDEFLARHPSPTAADVERVQLNTFVPAAVRSEYFSHMSSLHQFELKKDGGKAMRKQAETLSISPGLMLLEREERKNKREAETARQLASAQRASAQAAAAAVAAATPRAASAAEATTTATTTAAAGDDSKPAAL